MPARTFQPVGPHAAFPGLDQRIRSLRRRVSIVLALIWVSYLLVLLVISYFTAWWVGAALGFVILVSFAIAVPRVLRSGRSIIKMEGIHPVTARTQPALYAMIADTAQRMGIEAPPAWIIEDDSLNAFAFAMGLRKRGICFNTGWLKVANMTETRGVVAHELAHIANADSIVSALTFSSIGLLRIQVGKENPYAYHRREGYADMALSVAKGMYAVVGALATLAALAVKRSRESLADLTAAQALGGPGPVLATMALLSDAEQVGRGGYATPGSSSSLSTHPPTKARIQTLQELCGRQASWLDVQQPRD